MSSVRKVSRSMKKVFSLLLIASMLLGLAPLQGMNQVFAEEETPKGYVTFTVERFTVGQGFYEEPTEIPFYEGEDGFDIIYRAIGKENCKVKDYGPGMGNYLQAVKCNTGEINVPQYIKDKDAKAEKIDVKTDADYLDYDNPWGTGWLGEFSYAGSSGWMYSVNNVFPGVGMSSYVPKSGDVMRLQFTLSGYGADLGGGMTGSSSYIPAADKGELLIKVAQINDSENKEAILSNSTIKTAYDAAYVVLQNLEATQTQVDLACDNLNIIYTRDLSPTVDTAISTSAAYRLQLFQQTAPAFGNEWTIIDLVRSEKGNQALYDAYYDSVVQEVQRVNEEEGKVAGKLTGNQTEYSRLILSLTALGKDVTNVGGYDLLNGVTDYNKVKKQGINGPIWALIALDSHDYPIYADENATVQNSREKMIQYILNFEVDGGGWTLFGDTADPDITAMALYALDQYKDVDGVQAAIDRALDVLSSLQREDGGFASWGTINSESVAQVVLALVDLGIDPSQDTRFIKGEGNWLLSSLMDHYISDSSGTGFMHTIDLGRFDGMATDQAMEALISYQRVKEGKTTIFDMSDVVIENPLQSISLNKTELSLNKGQEEIVSVNYNPSDTSDDKTVNWTSSNSDVATVDAQGKITAVSSGTSTVTAKVGSQTATCEVTVTSPLESISLNKTDLILDKGSNASLIVSYTPSDTSDDKTVTWTSSNEGVATVDGTGKVQAVSSGTTTITAKVGDCTATCTVTVQIPLQSITLNKTELNLIKGADETLLVDFNPIDTTVNKTVVWTSSDDNIAKVDSAGNVIAVGSGAATITATVENHSVVCKITVSEPLNAIGLNKTELTMEKGSQENLSVVYIPEDTTDDKTATWTSSNENVATVDSNGKVQAITAGTTTITAKVGEYTASCEITVAFAIQSIQLDFDSLTVDKSEGKQLTATITPIDTTQDKTIQWTSSNDKVVTVNAQGQITFVGKGTATVNAKTSNGLIATCEVKATDTVGDLQQAQSVITEIDKLDKVLTLEDKKFVEKARTEYDLLDSDQKTLVDNLNILTGAEEKIKELVKEEENKTIPGKIKNADGNKLTITQDTPVILNQDILEIMKSTGKIVTFEKEENGKTLYSWTFDGSKIQNTNQEIDLTINYSTNNKADIDKLVGNKNSLYLHFNYHGALPAPADMKVYVGEKYKDGTMLNLYYYNEDTKKAEKIAANLEVKDGYVTFTIDHCSEYFLTQTEIGTTQTGTDTKATETGAGKATAAAAGKTAATVTSATTGDDFYATGWIVMFVLGLGGVVYFQSKKRKA